MSFSPFVCLALVLGNVALSGCATSGVQRTGQPVDAASAGSVAGLVLFTGTPPRLETIRMAIDPACLQLAGPNPHNDAIEIGPEGALANAFVYLKAGLDPAYTFEVPDEPAILDQRGCRFTPRVLGVRTGQPLELVNSDFTSHNVHATPVINPPFNRHQPHQGMRERRTFTKPEVMVPITCDLHGWMTAHVGVLDHPYFLVTGEDGSFALTHVPPGTYTVEAWHERLGTTSATVTVRARERSRVSLRFTTD